MGNDVYCMLRIDYIGTLMFDRIVDCHWLSDNTSILQRLDGYVLQIGL